MPERNPVMAGSTPSGHTVAARMDFWRSLSWEELVEYMQPAGDGEVIAAQTIDAPLVPARLRLERR